MNEYDINMEISNAMGHRMVTPFCFDLNAMHEAEKYLTDSECDEYGLTLVDVMARDRPFHPKSRHSNDWHATARQRAEAWLKTKGLWKE